MASKSSARLARAMSKQIFSVTQSAAARLQHLLHSQAPAAGLELTGDSKQNKPAQNTSAVKISLQRKGCSGLAYQMNIVELKSASPSDEVVNTNGVTLVVDSKAVLFLVGTEMDYVEDPLGSRFTFDNPNQKSACGCGKSFSV